MSNTSPGRLAAIKAWWAGAKTRHAWLRHVLDAWALMSRNNANQYAAAITYFSFLALFPLLLLAVSVTGFVLHAHPSLEREFFDDLARRVPGSFGGSVRSGLQDAIDKRAGVGIVGLVGVALAGSGWIGNLRSAIDAVWGRRPASRNFLISRVANLLVLAGLGVGMLISLGLTAVGTSLTDQILRAAGLDHLTGATVVLKVLGIAVAAGGDMVVFWWVLVRLPQQTVTRQVALRGTLMAAVGFEILKIVGTFTVAHATKSPTAGPFASLLAVLIWIQLVARFMLFVCAWMATAASTPQEVPAPVVEEVVDVVAVPGRTRTALFGAGAAVGGLTGWVLRSRDGRSATKASRHPW